ncbi:MAG: DNA primase [Candidatus Glassbacteria bacterium]
MSWMIPSEVIEDIKSRLDIVDVVSDHVDLKRVGKNYVGLCPFHPEKTPSFSVSQEKQIFHCFGCGKGGDLISFNMAISNSSFFETLETLAGQCGVELPSYDMYRDEGRDEVIRANEMAMMAYHRILTETGEGKRSLEYLKSRGVKKECIDDFLIGFAPARWKGIKNLGEENNISEEVLVKAGLLYMREGGTSSRDLFRNRIIFPIMDSRARVIGFGGRSVDGSEPKYLNTPETVVFNKGRNLYGLHLTKNEIRSKKEAVIVEGYMDLLVLYQAGCRNLVAPLGTALTENQAALLSKMCESVSLMYDADRAGLKAAFRAGDLLLAAGVVAKYVELPAGDDPASFVHANGIVAVQELIRDAVDVIDAKIAILRRRGNLQSIEGKRKAVGYISDTISGIKDTLMRRLYLEKCSMELNVPIDVLSHELTKKSARRRRTQTGRAPEKVTGKKIHDLTEKYIILLLLMDRCDSASFLNTVSELVSDDFLNEDYRNIFIAFKELAGCEGSALDLILSKLPQELHSTVSGIAMDESIIQNPEKMLSDCLRKLKARRIKRDMNEISAHLRQAKDFERKGEADELAKRFYELTRELSALFPAGDE